VEGFICGILSSHGGEYEDSCLWRGSSLMMEAIRTSETRVNSYQSTRPTMQKTAIVLIICIFIIVCVCVCVIEREAQMAVIGKECCVYRLFTAVSPNKYS
jgi:hypothetical protein